MRLGVIGGSSIAALACASRLWTGHGLCPRRSDALTVAAVRQQGPLALAEQLTSERLSTVAPLEGNGFRSPNLEEIEQATRTPQRWCHAWEVASTYDFRNFASGEKRAKCVVGKYMVVAESEAPLAPTCTRPDFAKRGPICKHAAGGSSRVRPRLDRPRIPSGTSPRSARGGGSPEGRQGKARRSL